MLATVVLKMGFQVGQALTSGNLGSPLSVLLAFGPQRRLGQGSYAGLLGKLEEAKMIAPCCGGAQRS